MHVEGQCCQRNKLLVKIWKGTESNVSHFSIENDRTQWITPWQKNFFQGFDCDFGRIISACNHVCLLSFWIQHIQKEDPGTTWKMKNKHYIVLLQKCVSVCVYGMLFSRCTSLNRHPPVPHQWDVYCWSFGFHFWRLPYQILTHQKRGIAAYTYRVLAGVCEIIDPYHFTLVFCPYDLFYHLSSLSRFSLKTSSQISSASHQQASGD